MARFEILNGPEQGRIVELPAGQHLVGRHSSAAFCIEATAVSGRHLELQVDDDGTVRFKDLGSTNGTWAGGMKVGEGEWSSGNDLRLGDVQVRLLGADVPVQTSSSPVAADEGIEEIVLEDPIDAGPAPASPVAGTVEIPGAAAGAAADELEDADLHRRAVEEALSGKRRNSPLVLVLFVLLLGGAAATYFLLMKEEEQGGRASREARGGAGITARADAIDDRGGFADRDAESWTLARGLTVGGGSLSATGEGRRRASLNAVLSAASGALSFTAQAEGLRAWPLIEWGVDDEDRPRGGWLGGTLGAAARVVSIPESAEWLRLTLILEGAGSLRTLRAEWTEADVTRGEHEDRAWRQAGSNFALLHREGTELFGARATGGSWTPTAGGFDLELPAGAWCELGVGPVTRDHGPFLILSEGGPQLPAAGASVASSPGLLVGGGAHRFLVLFDQPASLFGVDDRLRLGPLDTDLQVQLRWNMDDAIGRASRLERDLQNAARDGDTRRLLEGSAELLRDLPLNPEAVDSALRLRNLAIDAGQDELDALRLESAEALFLNATRTMEELITRSRGLADRLPGTIISDGATQLADDLAQSAEQSSSDQREREGDYRDRLLVALERSYPLLAAWVASQGEVQ